MNEYQYDKRGYLSSVTEPNGDTVSYTYDAYGNLVSQSATGAHDLAFAYDYDKSGRMTGESRTENCATLTSDYTYNKLGQLTGFERSDGCAESYPYFRICAQFSSRPKQAVKR